MVADEVIKKSLSDLKVSIGDAIARLRDSRGLLAIAKSLIEVVPAVVAHVEKVGRDLGLKGEDKKAAVVAILNAVIPWPWWIPAGYRAVILDMLIETVVSVFNRFWKKQA